MSDAGPWETHFTSRIGSTRVQRAHNDLPFWLRSAVPDFRRERLTTGRVSEAGGFLHAYSCMLEGKLRSSEHLGGRYHPSPSCKRIPPADWVRELKKQTHREKARASPPTNTCHSRLLYEQHFHHPATTNRLIGRSDFIGGS